MAVDITKPQSPGWWMNRLAQKQRDPFRLARLDWIERYYTGDFDLPIGAEAAGESYRAFQRKTRSNFAELAVAAVRERQALVSFRTAAETGETGDKAANDLWKQAEADVIADDVHLSTGKFGEAWVIVGDIDEETGAPLVTCEDPRQMVGEQDPANPRRTLAAYKTFYDHIEQQSMAYLYQPGQLWVATAQGMRTSNSALSFNSQAWTLREDLSGEIPGGRMPAVRFETNGGAGEFERHKDLLDRITDQILQRMVIATMQAFRQRAITNLPQVYPPGHPKAGQPINYDQLFRSDPAAVWSLPQGAEMWESSTTDISGILNAVKDDVGHFSAVTRTPMYMLMPEGANQSAEGATTAREGLVFKVEDRILRLSPSWCRVMANMFAVTGDEERAKLSGMQPIWRSPERLSLGERASAAAQATDVPWRTKMIKFYGFTPDEVDRMEAERADDVLLEQAFAFAASPAAQARAEGVPNPAAETPEEVATGAGHGGIAIVPPAKVPVGVSSGN